MTKIKVHPGPCGFNAIIAADTIEEDEEIEVSVNTGCKAVQGMMEALGNRYDAYEVCLCKPGQDKFHSYASQHFPVHAGCPVIISILKCIEAEAGLALKSDVTISFTD